MIKFFNSSTDLKVPETGSRGPAHKLHDNVDPTQGGDLLLFSNLWHTLGKPCFIVQAETLFIACEPWLNDARGMSEQKVPLESPR